MGGGEGEIIMTHSDWTEDHRDKTEPKSRRHEALVSTLTYWVNGSEKGNSIYTDMFQTQTHVQA